MRYRLYGVDVASRWRLPAPEATGHAPPVITFSAVPRLPALDPDDVIDSGASRWNSWAILRDGSIRFTWPQLFECRVSPDGAEVQGVRSADRGFEEAFRTHLFGHVLSFALVRRGLEPLHMTAVDTAAGAVAFTGDSGHGKSTLAADFVAAGHRLLTDDLLVLHDLDGRFVAHPGLPRLKLEEHVLEGTLGARATEPMAPGASKRLVPLDADEWAPEPVPLVAVYLLRPPELRDAADRVTIRSMSPGTALLAVSASTFNSVLNDPARMKRQFRFASEVASRIRVRELAYPAGLDRLADVREAVLRDSS